MNALTTIAKSDELEAVEALLIEGDLSKLNRQQKIVYYRARCERAGFDAVTKPFDYMVLKGKHVLYMNKGGAEQLRHNHGVSVFDVTERCDRDLWIVTAKVRNNIGREDTDIGVVSIKGLVGEDLANAIMKATTKAKRRATLSITGMNMPDETEVDSIGGARKVSADEMHEGIVEPERAVSNLPAAQTTPATQLSAPPPAHSEPEAVYYDFTQIEDPKKAAQLDAWLNGPQNIFVWEVDRAAWMAPRPIEKFEEYRITEWTSIEPTSEELAAEGKVPFPDDHIPGDDALNDLGGAVSADELAAAQQHVDRLKEKRNGNRTNV